MNVANSGTFFPKVTTDSIAFQRRIFNEILIVGSRIVQGEMKAAALLAGERAVNNQTGNSTEVA